MPKAMTAADRRTYAIQERRKNKIINKIICIIGAIAVIIYIAGFSFYVVGNGINYTLIASCLLLVTIITYYCIIGTRFYLRNEWVDAALFMIAFALQTVMTNYYAIALTAIGLSWPALLIINTILLSFAMATVICAAPRVTSISMLLMYIAAAIMLADGAVSMWAFLAYAMPLGTGATVAVFVCYAFDFSRRRAHQAKTELADNKVKSEKLLYSVLPQDVADRLKSGTTIADPYTEVSVIMIDIVGFTEMTRSCGPQRMIEILTSFFQIADECADVEGVERVKTIGDAYLGISGARKKSSNSAVAAINVGRRIVEELKDRTDVPWDMIEVRVGIHTGPVVGAVIGKTNPHYDYWGDTVNVATRLQQHASPGCILVSEATYNSASRAFNFTGPTIEPMRGVGDVKVYCVVSQKTAPATEVGPIIVG